MLLRDGPSPPDLDGRGVTFDRVSLGRVLDAIPSGADRRRRLGSARFEGATFRHGASFDQAAFSGPASFAGATFLGDARFGEAEFAAGVSFDRATFREHAWFLGVHFRGPASFTEALFEGNAWFQQSTFGAGVQFDGATFAGNAAFGAVTFSSVSSFSASRFSRLVAFERATFAAPSSWDDARFSVQGQGRPEASRGAEPAASPPEGKDPYLDTVQRLPPGRRIYVTQAPARSFTSRFANVLVPLLAVAFVVAAALIILRPDGSEPVDIDAAAGPTFDPGRPPAEVGPDGPAASQDGGGYNYERNPDGSPIRFNPCAPIRYAVNPAGAPADWEAVLREVVLELADITGLAFEDQGPTTERAVVADAAALGGSLPSSEDVEDLLVVRDPYQPGKYPGMWAPVLIQWSDLAAQPNLKGMARSDPAKGDAGRLYVSGVVVLALELDLVLLKAVLMHELGHIVGLLHVDDPTQVMAPQHATALTEWGDGDLAGLRKLGAEGGCLDVPAPSRFRPAGPRAP